MQVGMAKEAGISNGERKPCPGLRVAHTACRGMQGQHQGEPGRKYWAGIKEGSLEDSQEGGVLETHWTDKGLVTLTVR